VAYVHPYNRTGGTTAMGFFRFVTNGFINFFGITQPTPKQEKQATLFICALLAFIVIFAALVFTVVVMAFGR